MSDLVTVTAYKKPDDAGVARDTLDGAGIDASVDQAKVRVRNVDALRAGYVLNEQCATLDEVFEADEEPLAPVCRSCGSSNVVEAQRGLTFLWLSVIMLGVGIAVGLAQAAFLAVLALALVMLVSDRQRCSDCGEGVR